MAPSSVVFPTKLANVDVVWGGNGCYVVGPKRGFLVFSYSGLAQGCAWRATQVVQVLRGTIRSVDEFLLLRSSRDGRLVVLVLALDKL